MSYAPGEKIKNAFKEFYTKYNVHTGNIMLPVSDILYSLSDEMNLNTPDTQYEQAQEYQRLKEVIYDNNRFLNINSQDSRLISSLLFEFIGNLASEKKFGLMDESSKLPLINILKEYCAIWDEQAHY